MLRQPPWQKALHLQIDWFDFFLYTNVTKAIDTPHA
jgi:hypothetical protein